MKEGKVGGQLRPDHVGQFRADSPEGNPTPGGMLVCFSDDPGLRCENLGNCHLRVILVLESIVPLI